MLHLKGFGVMSELQSREKQSKIQNDESFAEADRGHAEVSSPNKADDDQQGAGRTPRRLQQAETTGSQRGRGRRVKHTGETPTIWRRTKEQKGVYIQVQPAGHNRG